MQSLKKFYFGKQKLKPNTFIGGVSATLNTPALVAAKLNISVARIKAFKIVGENIEFAVVGGGYTIPASCFINNTEIKSYIDADGLVSEFTGGQEFRNSTIQTVNFPNVTTFNNSILNFYNCVFLTSVSFPKLTRIFTQAFQLCTSLSTIELPLLTVTGTFAFANASSLSILNIPKCSNLGGSSTYNNVFEGIKIGCTINTNISLKTNNAGGVDGDLTYAKNTRLAIVNFYNNDGSYNSTL